MLCKFHVPRVLLACLTLPVSSHAPLLPAPFATYLLALPTSLVPLCGVPQLLEPSAAPLLAYGFPTLVDLALQKFDDGPGPRGVSLYLQVRNTPILVRNRARVSLSCINRAYRQINETQYVLVCAPPRLAGRGGDLCVSLLARLS